MRWRLCKYNYIDLAFETEYNFTVPLAFVSSIGMDEVTFVFESLIIRVRHDKY